MYPTQKVNLKSVLWLTQHSLNKLIVANRIHILEPQWNPSVESQAIGRVLRLGQQRTVTIVRYIMEETVEKVLFADSRISSPHSC